MMDIKDDKLHVVWNHGAKCWQATSKEGSYGLAHTQLAAVRIARDASATGFHGKRHIVIHHRNGKVKRTIDNVQQNPSPQFFQDNVE